MLVVEHLVKSFGTRRAVADVSFSVARGEMIGLLGPNGAGKSTTVAMLCGLIAPDAGKVSIDGASIDSDDSPVKRRIGLVPQDIALFEDLSALANLELFGALYGLSGSTLAQRVGKVLALVGLTDRARDKPAQFSGGMKRRLNIAAALVHDPDLLILDEPTAGVDPQSRNAIFDNLEALRKAGKAIVYTTHYMEEAERLADRIVIIDHGAVVAAGTPAALIRSLPASETLALSFDGTPDLAALATGIAAEPGIARAEPSGERLVLGIADLSLTLPQVLAWLDQRGHRVARVESGHAGLEDVFLALTGANCAIDASHHKASAMSFPIRAFTALVKKDLVLYFSNRRALIVTIVAPIAIAAFFGYLFGGAPDKGPSRIPIGITDLDASPLSQKIVTALAADSNFDIKAMAEAEAADAVRRGKLRAAIKFPKGFGNDAPRALFGRNDKPVVTVIYDPSQGIALAVVRGLLAQHVMQTVSQSLFSFNASDSIGAKMIAEARSDVEKAGNMSDTRRGSLLGLFDSIERVRGDASADDASGRGTADAAAGGIQLPYVVREEEALARPESKYNGYAHSFAGMGVQFILFMGIDLGVGLLLARRLGLWKRLRAAPVSRGLLLGSRVASGALIAALLFTIIFGAGIALFGVRISGSVVGFAGLIIAFALMTAAFGLFIASLGKAPETTRGLAVFATLVLVMLGGAWVPSFIFPQWLQTASLIMPTRWAVDGFDAMTWRGLGLEAAWAPTGVLLAFALVLGVFAVWRFEWDEK